MKRDSKNIDVVIPMYNEEKNIVPIINHIHTLLKDHFSKTNFILVDDGSTDNTENELKKLTNHSNDISIKYIRFAKNYGKDLALKCGIDHSQADICTMIDADFQHPPEKILEASKKLEEGYSIVHILKKEHNFGGKYRRFGSRMFSKLVNFLSGSTIDLTDFKVLDSKAVNRIQNFTETLYFSCGVIDLIGLKSTRIEYEPAARKYGESKFSLLALLRLALNSMMAVSIKPLRISIYTGLVISGVSLIYGLYIFFEKLLLGQPIPGFATLGTALFFLSGIQLLFLGIIGEYLGKTFIEVKHRPQYLIDYVVNL